MFILAFVTIFNKLIRFLLFADFISSSFYSRIIVNDQQMKDTILFENQII